MQVLEEPASEKQERICVLTFGWSVVLGNFRALVLFTLREASGRAFACLA